MATEIDANYSAFDQLPQEILTQIFVRVPVTERNQVRLVCKRWYDICNSPFVHKQEKFVFSGVHSMAEIVPVLLRSERRYFNLEFHNVKFARSTDSFWKKCGHKILELQLVDCDVSDDGIADTIIRCCHRLSHLSWKSENCLAEGTLWSDETLTTLLQQKFVQRELISLEINLCSRRSLTNYLLSSVFALFPNIRRFSFFYPLDRGFNSMTVDRDGNRQDVFTFSSIFNKLSAAGSETETLKLGSPLCAGFDWRAIALISQLTGLQEIEINDDILRVPENVLTTFVSRQTYLKSMKCTIRYTHARHFIVKLLRSLLTNCVHLLHLHLIYNGLVDIDETLLRLVSASKLKSFCIRCVDMNVRIPEKLPLNYSLRSFTLGSYSLESYRILSYGREEAIRLALLRVFRNLRYLEMNLVTDEVLSCLWKYQSSIRALKLSICGSCTDYGFTGVRRSQREAFAEYSLSSLRSENDHFHHYDRVRHLDDQRPDFYTFDEKPNWGRVLNLLRFITITTKLGIHQKIESMRLSLGYQHRKGLQYLELRSHEEVRYLTGEMFVNLNLPNLKYLRIMLPGNRDFYAPLLPLLEKCSLLEGLSVATEDRGLPYLMLAELISVLRRLRYLSIRGGTCERPFSVEKYENMFTLCPSLRFLLHRTATSCEKYYYDFLERQVVAKTSPKRYIIPTEKYETFYVNWFAL